MASLSTHAARSTGTSIDIPCTKSRSPVHQHNTKDASAVKVAVAREGEAAWQSSSGTNLREGCVCVPRCHVRANLLHPRTHPHSTHIGDIYWLVILVSTCTHLLFFSWLPDSAWNNAGAPLHKRPLASLVTDFLAAKQDCLFVCSAPRSSGLFACNMASPQAALAALLRFRLSSPRARPQRSVFLVDIDIAYIVRFLLTMCAPPYPLGSEQVHESAVPAGDHLQHCCA